MLTLTSTIIKRYTAQKFKEVWFMKKMLIIAFFLIPMIFLSNDGFLIGDPLPDAPELAYRGEYTVGVRTLNIVDKDRLDILNYSESNPNPTYDRPLTVEVWYPCEIE